MAEKSFKIEIVTPERIVISKDIVSLIVPGMEGSLGILADHAPLMVELGIGEITLRDPEGKIERMATSGGFMEVSNNSVRILADTLEKADEIDVARAEEAKRRAEEYLRNRDAGIDLTRAETSLKRAITRIRVAQGQ